MIYQELNKNEFFKIVKSIKGGFIYPCYGKLYKFDKQKAYEMFKYRKIICPINEVSIEQINWLSRIQTKIMNSYLPEGIILYNNLPVGVIYPHYFEDYSSFESLKDENIELIFDNIIKSLDNNMELIDNGIYNNDFTFKNILYRKNDVKLIDLDGKHIKKAKSSNYTYVFSYYMKDLFRTFYWYLINYYGQEYSKEIRETLLNIFPNPNFGFDRYTPYETVDKVKCLSLFK